MVEIQEFTDLKYISRVRPELVVMGTEDMEAFEKARSEFPDKIIGTHSDGFHADEVLACSMLMWTDSFRNAMIVRSRDQKSLDKLDLLADVGSVYDPETLRFDHHQGTFTDVWDANEDFCKGIRLSSAGLIFRHYGKEVVKNATKEIWGTELNQQEVEKVHAKLYKKLILEVDAQDNGVSEADNMKYKIGSHFGARVGRLNVSWNDPKEKNVHQQFKKAMVIAEEEFIWKLREITQVTMPAFNIVKEAWEKRTEFHPSGELLYLENQCPWKGAIFDLEKENKQEGLIKFMISQDGRKMWRILAVPPQVDSFDQRVSLLKEWRGKRDEELNVAAGLPDMGFVHATGFCGGAWSKESVIKMAEWSIEFAKSVKKD